MLNMAEMLSRCRRARGIFFIKIRDCMGRMTEVRSRARATMAGITWRMAEEGRDV